jgi:hypothetical protein
MSQRTVPLAVLTGGALAGLLVATITPAAAQGDPVYGEGNVYFLSGAYNPDGQAQAVFEFGDPDDEVYFGDWYGHGVDLPMVRRGNVFFVPSEDDPSVTQFVFAYGDPSDDVYIGDWDGDAVDSIAIRRHNQYFVKNDNRTTGVADRRFFYGDPEDYVLVGNWDGQLVAPGADQPGKGDTLTVVRGNRFFVKNSITTGEADYTFLFGDPEDYLVVGDWARVTDNGDGTEKVESSDGADQVAVVRGNRYHLSTEFEAARAGKTNLSTQREFAYGDLDDAVFVASFPTPLDAQGNVIDDFDTAADVIEADGLGVRRSR